MTIRLSTGLRNAVLDTGFKTAFHTTAKINIYSGSQPASAATGATGTLLGTVSIGGAVLQFNAPSSGAITKSGTWTFTGLANGVAGWFRVYIPAQDTPTVTDDTELRLDGSIGTTGADMNLTNLNIVTDQVNTVDTFTITFPAA